MADEKNSDPAKAEQERRKKEEQQIKEAELKKKLEGYVKGKNPYDGVEWITEGMGWEIIFKGMINHDAFYKTVHNFLSEKGYGAVPTNNADGKVGDDKYEILYEDRNAGGFREIWYRWRAKKARSSIHGDFYITFNCHLLGLSSKEVMYQNEKLKLHSVELDCWIKSGIKWFEPAKGGPALLANLFGHGAKDLDGKYFHEQREALEAELYNDTVALHDQLKMLLGLPTKTAPRQWMFSRRGYPMLNTESPEWTPHPEK